MPKLPHGFDGQWGWISIAEFDVMYPGSKSFLDMGFALIEEITCPDGTIFILLMKREECVNA